MIFYNFSNYYIFCTILWVSSVRLLEPPLSLSANQTSHLERKTGTVLPIRGIMQHEAQGGTFSEVTDGGGTAKHPADLLST